MNATLILRVVQPTTLFTAGCDDARLRGINTPVVQRMTWVGAVMLISACHDNSVVVTVEGSERTVVMIPRADDAPGGLDDGYTVVIEKLLVVVSNVEIVGVGGIVSKREARVFNLKKPGAFEVARIDGLAPGTYARLGFDVTPSSIARSGNADRGDVERMTENDYGVYLEGVATKKFIHAFRWGFDERIHFEDCASPVDVWDHGTITVPLVGHGERVFLPDGYQRFRDADQNNDAYTTFEEVEAMNLRASIVSSLATLFEFEGKCRGRVLE